jgi:hypothetical protein
VLLPFFRNSLFTIRVKQYIDHEEDNDYSSNEGETVAATKSFRAMRRKQPAANKQRDIDRELDRLGKFVFPFARAFCRQSFTGKLPIEAIWKLF